MGSNLEVFHIAHSQKHISVVLESADVIVTSAWWRSILHRAKS